MKDFRECYSSGFWEGPEMPVEEASALRVLQLSDPSRPQGANHGPPKVLCRVESRRGRGFPSPLVLRQKLDHVLCLQQTSSRSGRALIGTSRAPDLPFYLRSLPATVKEPREGAEQQLLLKPISFERTNVVCL